VSGEVISLLKGCVVMGGVVFTACFITMCCKAEALVRAYRRFVGEKVRNTCHRCGGTGESD
jgi:hypothetical protein